MKIIWLYTFFDCSRFLFLIDTSANKSAEDAITRIFDGSKYASKHRHIAAIQRYFLYWFDLLLNVHQWISSHTELYFQSFFILCIRLPTKEGVTGSKAPAKYKIFTYNFFASDYESKLLSKNMYFLKIGWYNFR